MPISTGTLQMRRLYPSFGVGIEGADLRQPLDDGTWAHIWEAEQMRLSRRCELGRA